MIGEEAGADWCTDETPDLATESSDDGGGSGKVDVKKLKFDVDTEAAAVCCDVVDDVTDSSDAAAAGYGHVTLAAAKHEPRIDDDSTLHCKCWLIILPIIITTVDFNVA